MDTYLSMTMVQLVTFQRGSKMKTYTLIFTEAQLQIMVNALAQMPWQTANSIIIEIQNQIQPKKEETE